MPVVIARWDTTGGKLLGTMLLPERFVAEGVAPLGDGRILVVDDLDERVLIAVGNAGATETK
ncbi:MAG: hypothetical protein U9R74_08335 [Pseudomonadota bacterium]|nr:hypothetical protein [Pseudomonadota bacterium]